MKNRQGANTLTSILDPREVVFYSVLHWRHFPWFETYFLNQEGSQAGASVCSDQLGSCSFLPPVTSTEIFLYTYIYFSLTWHEHIYSSPLPRQGYLVAGEEQAYFQTGDILAAGRTGTVLRTSSLSKVSKHSRGC